MLKGILAFGLTRRPIILLGLLVFVAAGLVVSLISASFARDEVEAGKVKLVELQGTELWRELGLAYRRDRTLSVATKAFVSVVRQLSDYHKKTEGSPHS